MACPRSTQTASNCQSNALSPYSRVPSLALSISPFESAHGFFCQSPAARPFNGQPSPGSAPVGEQPVSVSVKAASCSDSRPSDGRTAFLETPGCEPRLDSLCEVRAAYESYEPSATYQKVSNRETFWPTQSFGSRSPIAGHSRCSFLHDQQLCSAFHKASSDCKVALIWLIRLIGLIGSIVGRYLKSFAKSSEPKRFNSVFCNPKTALIRREPSKPALFEAKFEQTLPRAISKQPDIINPIQVSTDCRSFFKLWPFLFLLSSRLAFSEFSRSLRALPLNGIFQLLIIFCISTAPVSANLKVSVQGDILLGGIFPVHQKGKKRAQTRVNPISNSIKLTNMRSALLQNLPREI